MAEWLGTHWSPNCLMRRHSAVRGGLPGCVTVSTTHFFHSFPPGKIQQLTTVQVNAKAPVRRWLSTCRHVQCSSSSQTVTAAVRLTCDSKSDLYIFSLCLDCYNRLFLLFYNNLFVYHSISQWFNGPTTRIIKGDVGDAARLPAHNVCVGVQVTWATQHAYPLMMCTCVYR